MWLAQQGIVSTSMRDSFTAGGRETIITQNKCFENVPRVFFNIQCNCDAISMKILMESESVLEETWGVDKISQNRILQWIDIISGLNENASYPVRGILKAIFNIK